MTPHNQAAKGDYAEALLLPGDPARAEWIAQTLLDDARCVNSIRGELGFTGTYRGMPVSIQSTGIGRPSFSIYAHELITSYCAKIIVRIGSCGGLHRDVDIRSLVIARDAVMDFEYDNADAWRRPDARLFEIACRLANKAAVPHHVTSMVCSDVFYHADPLGRFEKARARGVLACDMETASAYGIAARLGVRSLSICTVVDSLVTGAEIAQAERQAVFGPMASLALDTLFADRSSA